MSEFKYVGTELEFFAAVRNWKAYWASQISPFIAGDVLEVGAGIGVNSAYLNRDKDRRWVYLEPDPLLVARLQLDLPQQVGRQTHEVQCGTTKSLDRGPQFDAILYIDVLEHIEHDREELETAAALLKPGGRVIVLSPAHQCLFTPFDAAIGHFRRYNRAMLRNISPASMLLQRIWYLDSAGLLLSSANLLFLRQSMPTKSQLAFWDKCVIPVSRLLDRAFHYSIGKSIIAVWQKPH